MIPARRVEGINPEMGSFTLKIQSMEKIFGVLCLCMLDMVGYSQPVATPPKKQPVSNTPANVNTQVKTPRLTPLCYGKVAADGKIISGTKNFHIQKATTGVYLLRCDGLSEFSIVIVTAKSYEYQCSIDFADVLGNRRVTIMMHKQFSPDFSDTEFQFIVYEP